MINYDYIIKEIIKQYNANQPQIHDYLYRISMTGGSGSGKGYTLINLRMIYSIIDKIYILRIQMKQNINISLNT